MSEYWYKQFLPWGIWSFSIDGISIIFDLVQRSHMRFFLCHPALITISEWVLCILVGLVVSPWKGNYRHQWYSNCVKLIHQIYNSCAVHCYTCTNVPCCMHWSTDMSSWHRIDYLMHRTTLNPGRSNRLWVCRVIAFQWWEWPLCHDNAIHVHTATRFVVVVGL